MKFNYLANSAVFPDLSASENLARALQYFDWLLAEHVDVVTIGNRQLLDFVRPYFPR